MIRSVTITNYLGSLNDNLAKQTNQNTVHITLNDAEPSHGMIITKITGLGPAKATLNRTKLATVDGSLFNSANLEERNIVMTIKFMEAKTIEDVRLLTYRYFPIKRQIIFSIKTDNRDARAIGYIESNEPDIFSPDEQANISIICPDPYFYSNAPGHSPHAITFTGLDSEFEAPWENEIDPAPLNKTLLGNITKISDKDFYYDGDQTIGVEMQMDFLDAVDADIILIHYQNALNPNEPMLQTNFEIHIDKFRALMGTNFLTGDKIIVNTRLGSESIYLLRNGEYHNILNTVPRECDWFQIAMGYNKFRFTTGDAGGSQYKINFRLEHYVIYEGV